LSGSPTSTEGGTRRQSLRRSKRIISLAMDGSQISSVPNQCRKLNESNDELKESIEPIEPQSLYQYSVSPKVRGLI